VSVRAFLERQRYVLDFTLASLARRKGKNLSLLLVYAVVVFALASVLLLTRALREQAAAVLRDAPELVVQRLAAGRHDFAPSSWAEAIAGIRGVASARGRLWGYYFDPVARANYTVMVPDRFWGAVGEITIGNGVARVRAVRVGDSFPMKAQDGGYLTPRVREVIPAGAEIVASDVIAMSEEDFRRLFGTPGGLFTDVVVRVTNEREVPTVAAKATHLLGGARAITRADVLRTYASIFDWRSGLVIVVLTSAVLTFVIVAWDKASGLSSEERREIGILKAIGWETSDVLLVKFWEGAVVSLLAFLAGALGAYAHVFLGGAVLFRPVLEGWSGLYPDLRLVPSVSGVQIATLLALTVVPYTAATIVPSWRAATVDPDAVMRS
jgi:ABC-type lipoprotein release transport system permease subunit